MSAAAATPVSKRRPAAPLPEEMNKKKQRVEDEGNEAPLPEVAPLPKKAVKRGGRGTKDSKRQVIADPKLLLPDTSTLAWSTVLAQPESLANMIAFVKPLHKDVTLFPSNMKTLIPDGSYAGRGFRGIAIDAIDDSHVCMTIARLECDVLIHDKTQKNECAVTVPSKILTSMLSDVRGYQNMVMYESTTSTDVCIAVSDTSGETHFQRLKTLANPKRHKRLRGLCYSYELSVPIDRIKNLVRKADDVGAESLWFRLRSVSPTMRVLCISGVGDAGHVTRNIPMHHVEVLEKSTVKSTEDMGETAPRTGPVAEDEAVAVPVAPVPATATEERNMGDLVAELSAPQKSQALNDDAGIPVQEDKLSKLPVLYEGEFAVKYLACMVKKLLGSSQVSLFLEEDQPLIMRFCLGKTEASYVAFVLAARTAEED